MQVKQGEIVEGKITGIAKYGVFVSIGGETSGMVHISEISSDFIKDVNDYFKLNQIIKAVVISVNDNGKLALSIKQLPENIDNSDNNKSNDCDKRNKSDKMPEISEEFVKEDKNPKSMASFENMMSKFKHDSDEKISDLKKSLDPKKTKRRLNQLDRKS